MKRITNLGLATLLAAAFVTGLLSQSSGTQWGAAFVTIHGVTALAIVALSPWKTAISRQGLARPQRRGKLRSLTLAGLVLLTIGSGLLQMTGTVTRIGPLHPMQIHVGAAFLIVPFVVGHYRRHPVRWRRTDWQRRVFLRGGVLTAVAGLAWIGWERSVAALGWPGENRRFTGSHERSSYLPAGMPAFQWLDDRIQHLDPEVWRLAVDDRSLTYEELWDFPQEDVTAHLDCTSGWYSTQIWRGIRLDRLIQVGEATSIEVRSITGYARRFPVRDLDRLWLALEVGAEPLLPGHGYPARLVAPDRRGFWWVKWVESIRPSSIPWWIQSPFPLT
jgi:hypothetical protein